MPKKQSQKILGLIVARGGSKGLPGKNVRRMAGKPLIAWTVEAALKSKFIDRVIVSTDDRTIAKAAQSAGAELPFMRPAELATDHAKAFDVVIHALNWCEAHGANFTHVALLQPTSPVRTAQDIDEAVKVLNLKKALAVVGVCEAECSPLWMNTVPASGCLKDFKRVSSARNRQELPQFYRINGAIYLADCGYFRKQHGFWGPRTFAYVMPKERSIDIDTSLDFDIAEFLLKRVQQSRQKK